MSKSAIDRKTSKFDAIFVPEVVPDDADQDEPVVPSKKVGRPRGKRSSAAHVQVTAYIQRSTHKAIKLRLIQNDDPRDVSEIIEEALQSWLKS